jgi:processive 1,2-diacylglycerol beta-glucosyltransferase
VICSTHMLYNYSLNRLFPEPGQKSFLQATVVTDSLTINRVWFDTRSDIWYVANVETKAMLTREGIDEEQIFDLGFPVSLKFDQASNDIEARDSCPKVPRVLYIVNSDKVDPFQVATDILRERPYALTMTLGKNLALRNQLEGAFQDELTTGRLTLHGWSNQIPELMMDHDVVIAKAGGATTQEAIAAHIPMLVTHIVPGQEEGNFLLLKKYDAGFHTPTAAAVLATLDRLFLPPGEAFVHATRQLKRLSRREPALTMAKHLLETRKRQTGGKHPG